MNTKLLNIYEYRDIVDFLQDYVSIKKVKNKYWSIGSWAKSLGLSSTASISNIIKGRRVPEDSFVSKMAQSIGLDRYEYDYFYKLFQLRRLDKQKKLRVLIEKELKISIDKDGSNDLCKNKYQNLLSNDCFVIRELVNMKDFKEDTDWIQDKLTFKISKDQIIKNIQFLLDSCLITRDQKTGFLKASNESYLTTNNTKSDAIRNYHKNILKKATNAIDQIDINDRHITGNTFCVNKEDVPLIKAHLDDFRKKIMKLYEKPGGDSVYQLENILIPLTQND